MKNVESLQGRAISLVSFSPIFFPFFSSTFLIAGVATMWMGVDFSVWNSNLRLENGGDRIAAVGFWNQLSALQACILRYLKIVRGAN